MKAVVFTNGQYENLAFYKNYLENQENFQVICADGGANAAHSLGITPQLLVGDMDSIHAELLADYSERGVIVEPHSTHKDETDTELAIEYCVKKGFDTVVILGALGSRFDHSFGNLYLLNRLLKEEIQGEIVNESNRIFLVKDSAVLDVSVGTTVSVLAFTDQASGINLKGFEYPVKNGVMAHFAPGYGISNVTVEKCPEISVEQGILMVDIINE
ncbi:thiamine pyrophosphokinase [Eubacterium limosum]|nr:thiamine pyrophosphokinase [Eubacterium limosum]